MLFSGEVAIITGGAQGIGKAIAQALSTQGAKAAVFDIDEASGADCVREIESNGGTAQFFKCDVRSVDDIKSSVQAVADAFGRIDILVNNAGILHTTPIEEVTEPEWDNIMDVNIKSVFFMSQQVLPHMKQQGGSILNMSSVAGRMGGIANGLGYSASKAGIIGLTYGFANRLAKYNINVNAIAPGTTQTDIIKSIAPEKLEALRTSMPLGRLGTTEDIANAAVFLVSSSASFITGAVLDVNGGMFVG
ncbi:MAG: 3-oxoacyl-ACP reductase FabG [Clostridia bacterium]|jgi:NAD(P)-dependent dehydrogenase (short-subunit alcohol dehydrogenase family)|nr:3-oxoacyl-ACP reductase FabG [Clostridia bacterium]MBT7123503.1 3-oxoacyl-ACP reductase FabG [Clostridia bacterium]